jgi:acyl transferase domain-containing protein/acyl carrier protein/NAD(P)-dependent dehydrogenase (short-subunit alcohol dehydrogenase family)
MKRTNHKAIAIVGIGAVMPDAPDLTAFWNNLKQGKYSISEVPPGRWNPDLYYDPDRKVPDKTYTKIGGWVKDDNWNPLQWRLPIPPRVSAQMDNTQRWAITAAREALMDFGYPNKEFNHDRTAVILGVAMGGDRHLYSAARIMYPEYVEMLNKTPDFVALPAEVRSNIIAGITANLGDLHEGITEDTMPGELSNIVAGRIAALYNFHGPNYITDAACASAMAGISAAIEGLEEYDFDTVVTGGIDANMSISAYVKFCKIGALSATGTRPYAEGADGFVMGEGGAVFVLKRLEDAERDGDKIYAVIRAMGGSSDGKGKGITAPNPIGQQLAIKRAWGNAGVSLSTASLIEGHGTSTSVGDAVELRVLNEVLGAYNLPVGSIALGSVKSNIGHLKGAAGAAGIAKVAMAMHEKVLPPSLNFHKPNPGIDFSKSPFAVNTELRPWETRNGEPRRAGVSAFGFGGTNFHVVMEEYIPGKITSEQKTRISVSEPTPPPSNKGTADDLKAPLRGALVKGGDSIDELINYLESIQSDVEHGWAPEKLPPLKADLEAPFRIAIDFANSVELAAKIPRALKGLRTNTPGIWKPLNAKGIFFGKGTAPKAAFLFTGQGSQYINMLRELRKTEPIVADTFAEADKVMEPLIGRPLSEFIFIDDEDPEAIAKANRRLMQTEITQPAVLTVDIALYRMMKAYGMYPDYVMGHSLGEYGALVASRALTFVEALKAVSARGNEMAKVQVEDKGLMVAVFSSPDKIQEVIDQIDGYVEIANVNSYGQSVIGGETEAVTKAMAAFKEAGFHVAQLPVSHAFHTRIVGPATEPLGRMLKNIKLKAPYIPIIANVTGEFYPSDGEVVPKMIDILKEQIASPVQFVKGVNTLYEKGARVFAEMGPKKALQGFVRDILAKKDDVMNLFANHPKIGGIETFNQCLCGLYAAGMGYGREEKKTVEPEATTDTSPAVVPPTPTPSSTPVVAKTSHTPASVSTPVRGGDRYERLGRLFVDFMDKANQVYAGGGSTLQAKDIWITGASLGLPKVDRVFQDSNVEKLLRGDQMISNIPHEYQQAMLDKNITRLVKTGKGGPRFETLSQIEEVIKLAARKNNLDIVRDFGYPQSRKAALDSVTELAIGAGIDALRDAGIPLVMHYKTTTTGSKLPDRWLLPEQMKDDTGVIFASAFPGYNAYAKEMRAYFENKALTDKLNLLQSIRRQISSQNGTASLALELDRKIEELRQELESSPYHFNRRFLLRVLAMGHSQFAEYIGARGPNTQVNAACASTTQAVGLAKDWIEAGRCRRVIIIAGDDITSDDTIDWFSSGFLAVGAAATDEKVENAALPFDKRRHGMIVGMGGAAIVVEEGASATERGVQPICEVLGTTFANSAFHATRLEVDHIKMVMENMIAEAERKWGIDRYEIANQMVFVSHETYTPARGGSASAEINALRHVFKEKADNIVIANTKGMTGHAMGVGVEDVLAIKSLETGLVPPVPNFKEVDPELGLLNLSKGGNYPVRYALRLGAGFGSQISMTLYRWTPVSVEVARPRPDSLGYHNRIVNQERWQEWLRSISGKNDPEVEVFKRTLRIKDPMADKLSDAGVSKPVATRSMPVAEKPAAPKPAPKPVAVKEAPVVAADAVKARVLALIAEQTGYPQDMLDDDLDLEADLGIDTVKQAELFAEIRNEYGIERDENLQLSEFPTLKHIIQFVYDKRPDLKQAPAATQAPAAVVAPPAPTPAPVAQAPVGDPVKDKILTLISEQTGYPMDMLELDLDLEADLGIDTVKQAELFAEVRGEYGIERDENLQLSEFPTLGHIIQFVYDKRPDLKQAPAAPVATQAPAAVVAPPAPTPAPVAQAPVGDLVKDKILTLISEQTGYPIDMLELDLDLEADLGIDTVKQAELFAEVRGEYGIERDENLQLSEFPTLAHIIQFVYDKRPDLKQAPAAPAATQAPAAVVAPPAPTPAPVAQAPVGDPVKEKILSLISEQTGYPIDMLELDLDLEADLGIDTVKQAELFAEVRGEYGIERDENLQLSEFPTLAHIIQFVYDKRPDLKQAPVAAAPVSTPAPAAVVAPSPTQTPAPVAQAPAEDPVKDKILSLISEQTGYPIDMLELDLDLEADLGIDTVKQAELFAEVRGEYGIERDENLQLSEFPTLSHIIQFVYNKRPDLKQAPAAAPAPTLVPSPAPETVADDEVKEKVLALVAEKTGYPADMLELDLDLEADLGIDTVKQAELFAEIRGEYGIARDEDLQLADFPTLSHIIQFVYDRRPSGDAPVAEPEAQVSGNDQEAVAAPIAKGDLNAVKQIPRRVPVPQLRPELPYCKASGVELNADSTVLVLSDNGGVGKSLLSQLKKKGATVHLMDGSLDAEAYRKQLAEWSESGPIQGVYWLPALDMEGDFSKMTFEEWKAATQLRVKLLYTTMRELQLLQNENVFLVSATRMGGNFGYDDKGALAPLGGAVSGFTKAYKRENPDTQVKVVDFEKSRKTKAFAELLIAETLNDPGVVEVGYKDNRRWTIGLEEQAQLEGEDGMELNADSTFLVTGAAGSITSAITADLAAASGGTFFLLDLTPEPDRNNPDLARFGTDKDGLKRDLFARMKATGEKVTPVKVEKELSKLERSYSALAAIKAVENAGGTAYYYSVNLLDGEAVAAAVQDIRSKAEKIDVLLHAGGIEISRLLGDKSPEEFNLVFDIKSDGWYHLLSSFGDHPIGATVVFSSIAGRFGNGGQTDYSAANDFLCKSSSNFRSTRPETRGIALDWTAWKDIGMAARGSIPTIMKAAGIDMLPPEAGIPFIRKELIAGTVGTEVVVAQSLGIMMEEFDETGGLNPEALAERINEANGVMIQEVTGMGLYTGLTTRATFDPKEQGFLFDHEINGTPVLPGVMGVEAMVEATRLLFPEYHVKEVEDVDFLAPFKFYRSEPRDVMVKVNLSLEAGEVIGHCELFGSRKLLGQEKAEIKTHFKARIKLSKKAPKAPKSEKINLKPSEKKALAETADIYQLYFHGPAYQVIEKAWKEGDKVIGLFNKDLPANHDPAELNTLAMPRLVELCFQTAGIWEMGAENQMGLPMRIDSLNIYRTPTNKRIRLYALVNHDSGAYDATVIDSKGQVYLSLKGYATAAFSSDIDEKLLEPLKLVAG